MYRLPFKRMLSDPYVLAKAAIFAALAWLCLGQILPGVLFLWETPHAVSTLNVTTKRPVYILTSRATFSAAEDFAYAMQTRGRAIVVGEATHGGAHPIAPFRLNEHFVALIPVAQSISPVTHANWEGVGVRPGILVPANQARSVATIAILKRQLAVETDPRRRARIQDWLAQER